MAATVGIYLNFMGNTEEAFNFYRSAFGGEFTMFQRHRDVPGAGGPNLREDERDKIMHVDLAILDGTHLFGTDMLKSLGHELRIGNNVTISLNFDDLAEARRLFAALSEGATEKVDLSVQGWGAWWGVFLDRYGVRWMFNIPMPEEASALA